MSLTDRDIIARAIHDSNPARAADWDALTAQDPEGAEVQECLRQAAAVLAVIGDRLLPAMPDDWWWLDAEQEDGTIVFQIRSWPTKEQRSGTGSDLAAAARDALRGTVNPNPDAPIA